MGEFTPVFLVDTLLPLIPFIPLFSPGLVHPPTDPWVVRHQFSPSIPHPSPSTNSHVTYDADLLWVDPSLQQLGGDHLLHRGLGADTRGFEKLSFRGNSWECHGTIMVKGVLKVSNIVV